MDTETQSLLDEIGVRVDTSKLMPYSKAVRWWMKLPEWIAWLFPTLRARAYREQFVRQIQLEGMVIEELMQRVAETQREERYDN